MPAPSHTIRVQVTRITPIASEINLIELTAAQGQELPPFTAGSHIDLHLSNGMIRSYSLSGSPDEPEHYLIGVKNEPEGRGGSRFIHEQLQLGDDIEISAPRNNFGLHEEADHTVLIAGGIGVTPLVSMSQRLETIGKPWELHYAGRHRGSTAFIPQLSAFGSRVNLYLRNGAEDAAQSRRMDIPAIVEAAPAGSHFYCCGPAAMINGFLAATTLLPPDQVHFERFANDQPIDKDGSFTVILKESGETIEIRSGQTILDALLERGIDAPYSCMEGICSACETRVLAGIPDHHDMILSAEQKAANNVMMICCSRSKTPELVLAL
jgi:vanillate O-demethylase ferredoxin subunit